MVLLFGTLITLAKIGFLIYILFAKKRDLKYYKNCFLASITFFILALLECLTGNIPYISLIVWGILSYMNYKQYSDLKEDYDDDREDGLI